MSALACPLACAVRISVHRLPAPRRVISRARSRKIERPRLLDSAPISLSLSLSLTKGPRKHLKRILYSAGYRLSAYTAYRLHARPRDEMRPFIREFWEFWLFSRRRCYLPTLLHRYPDSSVALTDASLRRIVHRASKCCVELGLSLSLSLSLVEATTRG